TAVRGWSEGRSPIRCARRGSAGQRFQNAQGREDPAVVIRYWWDDHQGLEGRGTDEKRLKSLSATARTLEPCPEGILSDGRMPAEGEGPTGRELGQLGLQDAHAIAIERVANPFSQ